MPAPSRSPPPVSIILTVCAKTDLQVRRQLCLKFQRQRERKIERSAGKKQQQGSPSPMPMRSSDRLYSSLFFHVGSRISTQSVDTHADGQDAGPLFHSTTSKQRACKLQQLSSKFEFAGLAGARKFLSHQNFTLGNFPDPL